MKAYFLSFLATILFGIGAIGLVVGVHDYGMPEDSRVVWVCSVHGNGTCGPDTPAVLVDPSQILFW